MDDQPMEVGNVVGLHLVIVPRVVGALIDAAPDSITHGELPSAGCPNGSGVNRR